MIPQIVTAGLGSFGTPSAMITRGLDIGEDSQPTGIISDLVTNTINDLIKEMVR